MVERREVAPGHRRGGTWAEGTAPHWLSLGSSAQPAACTEPAWIPVSAPGGVLVVRAPLFPLNCEVQVWGLGQPGFPQGCLGDRGREKGDPPFFLPVLTISA